MSYAVRLSFGISVCGGLISWLVGCLVFVCVLVGGLVGGYPLYRRLGGQEVKSDSCTKSSVNTRIQAPDSPATSESLYRCHKGILGE